MIDTTELRSLVSGPVLTVDDAGFADEVAGFNLAVTHTPDVVVGAATAADVLEAVLFARELGLPVRVQSTGHGVSEPVTDCVLITTSRLDALSIDEDTRIATIGAGVRWDAVIALGAELGLAPVAGSSARVGVVGYLTGGGLGPLSRSHGFSSDYVRGFTVVTGACQIVEATPTENPDLYWALRGGKTGLGIVTEVRVELVELPSLYAGSLLFENDSIEAVVHGWFDYAASVPDTVSTSIALMRFPPIDAVPEPMRGKNFVSVRFAFPGDPAEGERLAEPLRALGPVFVDGLGLLPIADVAQIHNDPAGPSPAWSRGTLLSHADDDLVRAVLSAVGPGARIPFVVAEIRLLGGATTTDVAEGSAVGGRSARFTFTLIGAPEPSLFARIIPEASNVIFATLAPWTNPESNINFGNHDDSGTPMWSPETTARLASVRAKYDPDRVFAGEGQAVS